MTGAKINAYAKDAIRTTKTVIGKYLINFPDIPGHTMRGVNAATVVRIDATTGVNIRFAEFTYASLLSCP